MWNCTLQWQIKASFKALHSGMQRIIIIQQLFFLFKALAAFALNKILAIFQVPFYKDKSHLKPINESKILGLIDTVAICWLL